MPNLPTAHAVRNKTPKSSPPPTHPSHNPHKNQAPAKNMNNNKNQQTQTKQNTKPTGKEANETPRKQKKLIALKDERKGKKYETAKP